MYSKVCIANTTRFSSSFGKRIVVTKFSKEKNENDCGGDLVSIHDKYVKDIKERHDKYKDELVNAFKVLQTKRVTVEADRKETISQLKTSMTTIFNSEIESVKNLVDSIIQDVSTSSTTASNASSASTTPTVVSDVEVMDDNVNSNDVEGIRKASSKFFNNTTIDEGDEIFI